jgi:hypothetical protein
MNRTIAAPRQTAEYLENRPHESKYSVLEDNEQRVNELLTSFNRELRYSSIESGRSDEH